MGPPDIAHYVLWLILLTVIVGLPALLHRSRTRAWHRNQGGACGRCGRPLQQDTIAYVEGFRVCGACAQRLRWRATVGIGFIALFVAAAAIGSFFAIAADSRNGTPDPWWVYIIGPGLAVMLGALLLVVVRAGRAANRRAAAHDATIAARYEEGGDYQP